MAAKKTTKKKTTTRKKAGRSVSPRSGSAGAPASAQGKHLVIVESPAKAKTINRYLGPDYVVRASVGHIRDLPSKNPKGVKAPVPGVNLEKNFDPTYEVLEGKNKTVTELRKLAKEASDIWFATDMDREGEAIAWHLAELLKIAPGEAQRVVFNAITKEEIARAFQQPHTIDMHKVDAQQARRVLDRIVGYQVSPLLWKKVARGLSAGRVQSVAVRLIVEREREIRAHVPDESWAVKARFTPDTKTASALVKSFEAFQDQKDARGKGPTVKDRLKWLSDHHGVEAELVEVGGKAFDIEQKGTSADAEPKDLSGEVINLAKLAGIANPKASSQRDDEAKGPAKVLRTVTGTVDPNTPYAIKSIETKRTSSRPRAPFITSTLQQAASSFLGFGARRTMQAAQRLYEGVEIPGEGSVGLITYMRTDATFIAPAALNSAREYIKRTFGDAYLPDKPNFYSSSNKAAQEAHECIRPTSLDYPPEKVKKALKSDEYRLYDLIWRRFVSCQMTPAQWDSTAALIEGGTDAKSPLTFKATGRVLVFDGFYRVAGVPSADGEQHLPELKEKQAMAPFSIETEQKFSPPPPRYSEASLIKKLEEEGIGRPSTYASIVQVIQDRKYVESIERRFFATDLGEVVTDKLIEAFPDIMELGYTREMEAELDRIESDHHDWRKVLGEFYGPFKMRLEEAHESMTHAKAETKPAPYECGDCGAATVYRFGKNGVFLSCSRYPKCKYACPVDRDGKPRVAEYVNVRCPTTGRPMVRKTGRFGPFITTLLKEGEDPTSGIILNLDKKGHVKAPSPPPLLTELPCSKCSKPLALRDGVRGPWLGCSGFPKCRGRGKWAELDDATRARLEKELDAHMKKHPVQVIYTLDGRALTDAKGKPLPDAPTIEQLLIDDPAEIDKKSGAA
ncbi:MAG: type I DNA topoisomerase [Phycisphaerales bacterium]|nr:type I DNA topoisomerase [Phycisphaerales bacterium]